MLDHPSAAAFRQPHGNCGDENPTTLFEPLPFFHVSLELEAEAPHDTEKISMAPAQGWHAQDSTRPFVRPFMAQEKTASVVAAQKQIG